MEPRVLQHDSQGQGEPVVLIPGGLTGWLSWIPHQKRLAGRHRAIRIQPIHNELGSAGLPGDPGYTAETEREALRLTLDALGLESSHLVGWSGGGKSALEFAIEYPDRVRSLTLVEPAAYWILEQLGVGLEDVKRVNSLVHGLFGRPVTGDDLAMFLELAGFVQTARDAPSHPNWDRWLSHRMAFVMAGRGARPSGAHAGGAIGHYLPCAADQGDEDGRLAQAGGRCSRGAAAEGVSRGARRRSRPPHREHRRVPAGAGGAPDAHLRRPAGVSERASQSYRGAADGTSTSTPTTAERPPTLEAATVARHAPMVHDPHRTSYTYDGAADPSEPGGRALDVRDLLFHESRRPGQHDLIRPVHDRAPGWIKGVSPSSECQWRVIAGPRIPL